MHNTALPVFVWHSMLTLLTNFVEYSLWYWSGGI